MAFNALASLSLVMMIGGACLLIISMVLMRRLRRHNAVHRPGQLNVHQHQVGAQRPRQGNGFVATAGMAGHRVAHLAQLGLNVTRNDLLVFNNQDSGGRHGPILEPGEGRLSARPAPVPRSSAAAWSCCCRPRTA